MRGLYDPNYPLEPSCNQTNEALDSVFEGIEKNRENERKKAKKADRDNKGKRKLSYLLQFPHAMDSLVYVCEQGENKYGRNNWKNGGRKYTEYVDSCLRHLQSAINNQDIDQELGSFHLANAAWNCLALLEMYITNNLEDDRNDDI